jgi:benzaldehyde dehydrogenase (NAD)
VRHAHTPVAPPGGTDERNAVDRGVWQAKIFSDGWVPAHGGDMPIIEPATGHELGRAGLADATDVQVAVASGWITIRSDIPAYPF